MTVAFRPLSPAIGATVEGVDLAGPIDDKTFAAIHAAWLKHVILLFPKQTAMSVEAHIAFSRRLGALDTASLKRNLLEGHPEIFVVSNVDEGGKFVGARVSRTWHSDGQYLPQPTKASMLHAREIPPEGGDTLFANMYAAYDALPEATKARIDRLRVVHSRVKTHPILFPSWPPLTDEQKATMPDVVHPLVRTHPETGRKALYVGGNSAYEIEGMSHDEGRRLIQEIREFAIQDRFVYRHRWSLGDAILWDNRCAMHCPTAFDEQRWRRVMYRTTVKGDVPA